MSACLTPWTNLNSPRCFPAYLPTQPRVGRAPEKGTRSVQTGPDLGLGNTVTAMAGGQINRTLVAYLRSYLYDIVEHEALPLATRYTYTGHLPTSVDYETLPVYRKKASYLSTFSPPI